MLYVVPRCLTKGLHNYLTNHPYVSAPVDIDGNADIVTVLIKSDPNHQRTYIHSVTSVERLLTTPTSREPQAKSQSYAEVKASSADIHNILRGHLTHNPDSVSKVVNAKGVAPVLINSKHNIVTATVHRHKESQRMYLYHVGLIVSLMQPPVSTAPRENTSRQHSRSLTTSDL